MSDIGPRRTLDLRQPQPGQPAQPQPAPRPMAPAPRPVQSTPAPQVPSRPHPAPASQPAPAPATKAVKKGSGWKVVMQFIVGLLVIVGVATAIVALYVKYYQ